ncbi:MAG: dihydroorotase, partial [Methanosarcinales archaeon]
MTDTIIKNVRMLVNNRITEVNILINDSKIEKISKIVSINAVDDIINGHGDLALPSGIDVHVHFRDMKEKHKEDWYTGSCAAAAGGITTVVDHPNTQPPTLNKKSFYKKLIKARSKSVIDFGLNGGVESKNTKELTELRNLGVTAFGEIFGSQNFSEALDKIKTFGAVACIHAEDETINRKLMEKYKNNHNPGVH